MMKSIIVYIAFGVLSLLNLSAQDILINEVMASNARSLYNNSHNTPDWIELYNRSNKPINLKSYRISDKNDFNSAWQFPDTIIPPKSFCVIYADGLDTVVKDCWIIETAGWGLYQNNFIDSYRFDYLEVNGDFEISVEVLSVHPLLNKVPHAGLLITEEIKSMSDFIAIHYLNMSYQNWYWYTFREVPNTYPEYRWPNFLNRNKTGHLRMERIGDTVYTYCEDAYGFVFEKHSNYFPKKSAYIGLVTASSNDTIINKFSLRNFKLNKQPYNIGDLQVKTVNTKHNGRKYQAIELHANFKVSDAGETIYLWADDGTLVDNVANPQLPNDISFARIPDGGDTFAYIKNGTANNANSSGESYSAICSEPTFSIDGGWHNKPLKITIKSKEENVDIHYTTDGTEPSIYSSPYTGQEIHISQNMVVRAFAVKEDYYQSRTHTRTFFINDSSSLPVVAISANMEELTNKEGRGMFDNIFNVKKADVHFEYYDKDKELVYDSPLEMRKFGNSHARSNTEQPALRFDVRKYIGSTNLDYKYFGIHSLKEYETIRLRNAGSDWSASYCRDVFASLIANRIPSQISAAYQPILSFLNGRFFGLYNLREQLNESYFAEKYKIPEDSINILRNFKEVTGGSVNHFYKFLDDLYTVNINSEQAIELINNNLDFINCADYTILSLYLSNFDWPNNNLMQWQSYSFDGKWRFICNDFDWSIASDDYYTNTKNSGVQRFFNNKNSEGFYYAKMVSKILENKTFRDIFLNRAHDLLNSVFLPQQNVKLIDSIYKNIDKEVLRQKDLHKDCMDRRDDKYRAIINFLWQRPWYYFEDFIEVFELSGASYLTLKSDNQNVRFRINSLYSDTSYYSMLYFHDVPIEVELIGGNNNDFLGWNKEEYGKKKKILVTLSESTELEAIFAKNEETIPLVINEIMYRPADDKDCKDWFEVYNPNKDAVSLAGYYFKDDNDEHFYKFPSYALIEGKSYLIISENPDEFMKHYKENCEVLGPVDFGLGKQDQIRLYDMFGKLVDSVAYSNEAPWPAGADRTGRSIELTKWDEDNNIGGNWQTAYIDMGTPCKTNSIINSIAFDKVLTYDSQIAAYPNPATTRININFQSDAAGNSSLSIYDIHGYERVRKSEIITETGTNNVEVDIQSLETGIYILQINTGGSILTCSLRVVR